MIKLENERSDNLTEFRGDGNFQGRLKPQFDGNSAGRYFEAYRNQAQYFLNFAKGKVLDGAVTTESCLLVRVTFTYMLTLHKCSSMIV